MEYVQLMPDSLDCPICKTTLRDPVEVVACQHTFCSECLLKWSQACCPIDRTRFDAEKGLRKASSVLRSLLGDAKVKCLQCEWQGTQETYQQHQCVGTSTLKSANVEQHEPVLCQYCSFTLIDAQDLLSHLANSCELVTLPCRYSRYGCGEKRKRAELEEHIETECLFHRMQGLIQHFEDRFDVIEDENTRLRAQVASLVDALQSTRISTKEALGIYYPSSSNNKSLPAHLQQLEESLTSISHSISSLEIKSEMQIANETMRLQEETQVLRQHLNGVRMQVWQLIMANQNQPGLVEPVGVLTRRASSMEAGSILSPPLQGGILNPFFRRMPAQDGKL